LKDSGEGSLAVVSEMDPKDAVKQLLMQETYSWYYASYISIPFY
jgi:hypothetical protein